MYGLYLARELYPKGIVYYSESKHYSIQKNIHLLNIPSIVIRSKENGEIDYDDLASTLQMNCHKSAIMLATFGTTMKEAKDEVSKIKGIFKNGADSISISGHKFIGSPMPTGILIAKRTNRDRIAKGISYIGSLDTTIAGPRNGHAPLFLWYALKKLGIEGLKERYKHSLDTAIYCKKKSECY